MRKRLPFALLFGLFLIGCGGSGGGSQPSAFAGQYSGNWQQLDELSGANPLATGTITFVIGENGKVSGLFAETTPGQRNGSVDGRIKADGTLTFDVAYSGGTVSYSGEVEKANGSIDGPFSQTGVGYGGFFPFMHLEPSDL